MTGIDDGVRDLLDRASGSPTLTRRDELMAVLVERIDAGGEDMADAPALTGLPSTMRVPTALRRGTKASATAAGMSLVGWVVMGIGSAAAATAGMWLLLDSQPEAQPAPETPPAVTAPASSPSGPSPSPSPAAAREPGDLPIAPDAGQAENGGPAEAAALTTLENLLPEDSALDPLLDTLMEPVLDPLLDTVAPIISSVDVEGLTTGVLGGLICGGISFSVTATDDVEVTSVSLRLGTAAGSSHTVPLTKTSAHQWSGVLAPLALTELGLLGGLVTVTVEARDAADNIATASTGFPSLLGPCGG